MGKKGGRGVNLKSGAPSSSVSATARASSLTSSAPQSPRLKDFKKWKAVIHFFDHWVIDSSEVSNFHHYLPLTHWSCLQKCLRRMLLPLRLRKKGGALSWSYGRRCIVHNFESNKWCPKHWTLPCFTPNLVGLANFWVHVIISSHEVPKIPGALAVLWNAQPS